MMFITSFIGYAKADSFDDMLKNAQDFNKLDFNFRPDWVKVPSFDWKFSNDMQNVTFDDKNDRNIYQANVITDNNVRLINIDNIFEEWSFSGKSGNEIDNTLKNLDSIAGTYFYDFPVRERLYFDMFGGSNGSPIMWYNDTYNSTLKSSYIDGS